MNKPTYTNGRFYLDVSSLNNMELLICYFDFTELVNSVRWCWCSIRKHIPFIFMKKI